MIGVRESFLNSIDIEKMDFNISDDNFQVGIFKAVANEEGVLININKTYLQ